MNNNQHPAITGKHSRPESGISRRELVRRLMIAGGAGFSLPAIAEARPIAGHLANHSAVAETGAQTAKAVWSPVFLDRHQSETLDVLGERIIPGSSEAQVNRFIDLLLSVDTQDAQTKFLAALSAFEAESLKRFSRPYKDSTETQQNEILAFASAAKPGDTAEGQSQRVSIGDHFENIKRWVADAYFSSEIGMKELGWTGDVFFTSFPGCPDSSGHRP